MRLKDLRSALLAAATTLVAAYTTPGTANTTTNPAEDYHARYGLPDVFSKRVDNLGEGFEPLYGVRNFREVLRGVLFRGGANNVYNRNEKRENRNPLPTGALENLCKEGFPNAIYLYPTNYGSAPHSLSCNSLRGRITIKYDQRGFLKATKEILTRIRDVIMNPDHGPLYVHCWNGWHASGFISALALRQFCGMPAETAVDYWVTNTDGNGGSTYDDHKDRIRRFRPHAELMIDAQTQARVCPSVTTGAFD